MYHEREDGEEDEGMMGFGFSFGLFLSQMDASSLSLSQDCFSFFSGEQFYLFIIFYIIKFK